MVMRKSSTRGYRPNLCHICNAPLPIAKRGRPRFTCSDRCRQIKRRQDYTTWIDPQHWKKEARRAEREVRQIEKALGGPGSLDIPTPGYEWLTLRKRVLIRLQRGEGVPFCKVCGRPYINDTARRTPTCRGRCEIVYREQQRALEEGLKKFAGRYDPRVDVRLRLGLPIKTCQHCGKPYPVYNPRRMYCSDQCCRNASYARRRQHTCSECGEVFRGKGKTCSALCYKRRWRQIASFCDRCQHAIKPGREMRYEPSYNGPDPEPIRNHHGKLIAFQEAVFCSAKCRDALGWSPSRKVCEECHEAYYPKVKNWRRRQKYCSRECIDRHEAAQRSAARAEQRPRQKTCQQCGERYEPDKINWRQQRYCSDRCKRQVGNLRRREKAVLVKLPERVLVGQLWPDER